MKNLTAFTIAILLSFLYFLGYHPVNAGDVKAVVDTDVLAFIDIDPFSTVEIDESNVEVGLWRDIRVRITDRFGDPLQGREISFFADPPGSAEFEQPTITDSDGWANGKFRSLTPGVFAIKAKDSTYPIDIFVQQSASAYVFPIPTPTLKSEPYYTKGTSNTVEWNAVTGLDSDYSYEVQAGLDSSFGSVVASSPLLETLSYTFNGLQDGKMYFYRVRSVNSGGGVSSWSEVTFSVQDGTAPKIVKTESPKVEKIGNVLNVTFKFTASDSLSLKKVWLYCNDSNGLRECGALQNTGSLYSASIPLTDLERGIFQNYKPEYSFCVKADDEAGNSSENCDFKVVLKDYIDDDVDIPVYTEIINYVFRNVNETLDSIDTFVAGYFSSLKALTLTMLGFLLLILSAVISLFAVLGSLTLVPVIIRSTVVRFSRVIGLIKHGAPVGVVYDAESKKPLRFAEVSIFDNNNVLVRRDFTNSKGEFTANLDIGRYRVLVDRKGYIFPSLIVRKGEDENYKRVYRGETIIVSKRNPMFISIPLDPKNMMGYEMKSVYRKQRLVHFLKHLNVLITVVGLLIAFYAFERNVTWFNLILLLLYIPVFGIYLKAVVKLNIGLK